MWDLENIILKLDSVLFGVLDCNKQTSIVNKKQSFALHSSKKRKGKASLRDDGKHDGTYWKLNNVQRENIIRKYSVQWTQTVS